MGPARPDDDLRSALRRLGEGGVRAEEFLDRAADVLASDEPRAPQLAAYALREALTAIVQLGGKAPRGVGAAARDVVDRWRADPEGERLSEAIRGLEAALTGPGPHDARLERVITDRARVPPTRAVSDLLRQFVGALDAANGWLHTGQNPGVAAVTDGYEAACGILRDLFGPISRRLTAMDELATLPEPNAPDVATLKQRLGDERHLHYLFDQTEGPGWFRALRDDELLVPPADRVWTAGPYVARIAESHPDEVRSWLMNLPGDLNAKQVRDALYIARLIKVDTAPLVLHLAKRDLDSLDIRFQVDGVLRALTTEEIDTAAVRSLIHWSLTNTLAEDGSASDTYMAAEQLQLAVGATEGSDPGAWLRMLAHRAREVAEAAGALRMQVMIPLNELSLNARREPLELISAGVLLAAAAGTRAGLPLDDRLERLRVVPEPLASRLVAQHLSEHLPATATEARDFIAGQIATNDRPSPEELALLRRLFADDVPGIEAAVACALGDAPPTLGDEPVSDAAIKAHRWLVAVPESAAPEWHRVDAAITEQVGPASQDGVMLRPGQAFFAGDPSPIGPDELRAMPPLDAAVRVASWRPDPGGSFLDPNVDGLARELRDAIHGDPDRWLAVDPVDLARTLQHPIYISVLVEGLSGHVADANLDAERIVALTELVRSDPWPVEDLGGRRDEPDTSWARAGNAAIHLLGELGAARALHGEIADRAWAQVADAAGKRDDVHAPEEGGESNPLQQAILRPSMRALEEAFRIGDDDEHGPSEQLLSLVEEILGLDGVDGFHGRAVLAPRLPRLRGASPAWFAEREERIFGDAAPDDLGPTTFDLYLEWGRAYGPLLEDQRDRVIDALAGDRGEDATRQLLHGLIWRLPAFDAAAVADALIGAGAATVSGAGHWLGWALAETDEIDHAPVVELWRELLDRKTDADAYHGFGWTAVNDHIDEETWLALMTETATVSAGNLDEPHRVAERAARSAGDPHAATIIARLLEGEPPLWDVRRIGDLGLEVLRATTDTEAATDLRERLLERSVYEAKDEDP
jgi:hypothetical protein